MHEHVSVFQKRAEVPESGRSEGKVKTGAKKCRRVE